jgi:hypothetical protein
MYTKCAAVKINDKYKGIVYIDLGVLKQNSPCEATFDNPHDALKDAVKQANILLNVSNN